MTDYQSRQTYLPRRDEAQDQASVWRFDDACTQLHTRTDVQHTHFDRQGYCVQTSHSRTLSIYVLYLVSYQYTVL